MEPMQFYVCSDSKADVIGFMDIRKAVEYADSLSYKAYIIFGYLVDIANTDKLEEDNDDCK